jgi:ABC-type Na+ efflux pump permease subunit
LIAITAIGVSVLVCFLFSLFCSAGALLITIGSKDKREANNLIAFFSTILGFATLGGLAPGFATSAMAKFIPVLNMMVLLHQSVTGELSAAVFCQVLSEDIVIIGAMLWLACRLLADEGLLFDVQAKGPLVLLTGRARR